jgi:hypothetical protein
MPKPARRKARASGTAKAAPRKPAKEVTRKKAAAGPARKPAVATMKFGPRKDLGAPVDGFFASQPPHLLPIVERLRAMIAETAPAATGVIKWGMPFYSVRGNTMCAIAAFKSHVNLILPGPSGTYADPDGLLEGDGKTGKHLKLRTLADLPTAGVRGWLETAAARAAS